MEPTQPNQVNDYQSNTYRKDLSCLYFGDGSRDHEKHQAGD